MRSRALTKYKVSFIVELDSPVWREKVLDAVNAAVCGNLRGMEVVDDSNTTTTPIKAKIIDVEIL